MRKAVVHFVQYSKRVGGTSIVYDRYFLMVSITNVYIILIMVLEKFHSY